MPTTLNAAICPLRTETPTAIPIAGNLETGEIALNLYEKKLYSKTSSGTVVQIGGDPPEVVKPMEISAFFSGTPLSFEALFYHTFTKAVTFPTNLAGSFMKSVTAASASTVFSLKKNGSQFATATFAPAAVQATFSGSSVAFAVGDVLSIDGPGTADGTIADIFVSLTGVRN